MNFRQLKIFSSSGIHISPEAIHGSHNNISYPNASPSKSLAGDPTFAVSSSPSSPVAASSSKLYCSPCKKAFNSEATLETHQKSQKHKVNSRDKTPIKSRAPKIKPPQPMHDSVLLQIDDAESLESHAPNDAIEIYLQVAEILWESGDIQKTSEYLSKVLNLYQLFPKEKFTQPTLDLIFQSYLSLARITLLSDYIQSRNYYFSALEMKYNLDTRNIMLLSTKSISLFQLQEISKSLLESNEQIICAHFASLSKEIFVAFGDNLKETSITFGSLWIYCLKNQKNYIELYTACIEFKSALNINTLQLYFSNLFTECAIYLELNGIIHESIKLLSISLEQCLNQYDIVAATHVSKILNSLCLKYNLQYSDVNLLLKFYNAFVDLNHRFVSNESMCEEKIKLRRDSLFQIDEVERIDFSNLQDALLESCGYTIGV